MTATLFSRQPGNQNARTTETRPVLSALPSGAISALVVVVACVRECVCVCGRARAARHSPPPPPGASHHQDRRVLAALLLEHEPERLCDADAVARAAGVDRRGGLVLRRGAAHNPPRAPSYTRRGAGARSPQSARGAGKQPSRSELRHVASSASSVRAEQRWRGIRTEKITKLFAPTA